MSKLPEHLKQWHNIVTETAKISELKEGDLVLQSGLVWRLENHRSFPPSTKSNLPIHLFDSNAVLSLSFQFQQPGDICRAPAGALQISFQARGLLERQGKHGIS